MGNFLINDIPVNSNKQLAIAMAAMQRFLNQLYQRDYSLASYLEEMFSSQPYNTFGVFRAAISPASVGVVRESALAAGIPEIAPIKIGGRG